MKRLIVFFVLLMFVQSNAQTFLEAYEATRAFEPSNNLNGSNSYDGMVGNSQDWNKIMSAIGEFDNIEFNKKGIDGSVYLFDDWKNKGIVEIENKRYVLSSFNYNIKKDAFMTKIEGDSIFIFDVLIMDKVFINDRKFKSFYSVVENQNKFHEVLYEDENKSLVKGYFVSYVEASPNPMVNRRTNKIKQGSKYFIYKDGALHLFKLKKSSTLDLFNDDQAKEIEKYLKSNNLSYKKEKDLVRIFEHMNET